MNILGIDSSAVTASAAVSCDGRVMSDEFVNAGLTHSETLAPMAAQALEHAGMKLFDMDVIAVTHGPGSFTGVRIGVSFAKGLAQPMEIPCMGVSSLAAAAYPFRGENRIILACMDARCNQLYAAFFRGEGEKLCRLTPDEAIPMEQAVHLLLDFGGSALICGDGARVAGRYFSENGLDRLLNYCIPEGDAIYQRASSVALLAEYELLKTDKTPVSPKMLAPVYLRLSQAERELKKKGSLKRASENK